MVLHGLRERRQRGLRLTMLFRRRSRHQGRQVRDIERRHHRLHCRIARRLNSARRVIDRATFQSFGCQNAIAVASVATELIRGKTSEEALSLSGEELSAPLGALPPMKIHCAQLVEQALQSALVPTTLPPSDDKPSCSSPASTLSDQLHPQTGKFKINILPS